MPTMPIRCSCARAWCSTIPRPAPNGTMLVVLTRLALLTGETEYMGRASTLAADLRQRSQPHAERRRQLPGGLGISDQQPDHRGDRPQGPCQDPGTAARLLGQAACQTAWWCRSSRAMPCRRGHPAAGRGMEGGHPTAYICQAGTCSNPFTNAAELAWALTLPPQLRPPSSNRRRCSSSLFRNSN